MVTGKPMWSTGLNIEDLKHQITSVEVPDMPAQMSEQGKDFLRRCLDRNPAKRWTAEMLSSHPFITIGDFATIDEGRNLLVYGSPLGGTPLYSSPESVLSGKYEAPMDIWALGCTIIEMVAGKPMWSTGLNIEDLKHQITSVEVPDMPAQMSEQGKDFLRRCLDRNPAKRWTAEMLLSHPFITIGDFATIDEGRNLLVYGSPLGFGWVSSLSLFSVNC
ncbi:hypothetical protein LguiA_026831 [Lonicera macranthoides]